MIRQVGCGLPFQAAVVVMSFCLQAFAAADSQVVPEIRRPGDGRTWQVARSGFESFVWHWPKLAESAELTVTSSVPKAVWQETVVRETDAVDGAWPVPAAVLGRTAEERLIDVTVVFRQGDEVLSTLSARVVFLPDATQVLPVGSDEWKQVKGIRPVPYDPKWAGLSAATDSVELVFAPDGQAAETVQLSAEGGWFPLDPKRALADAGCAQSTPFTLSLGFDGDEPVYVSPLERLILGTVLLMR